MLKEASQIKILQNKLIHNFYSTIFYITCSLYLNMQHKLKILK